MSKENLTLFQTEDCPYCALVRRKLDLLGLACKLQPVSHEGAERSEVQALSGQNQVPLLQDEDQVILGSSAILAYLDQTYGSGSPTPLPSRSYGISCVVEGDFAGARAKTLEVFKEQGFGLLTEINVQKTMKEKLGIEMEPNSILGFCNPKFAHQGMTAEPDLGLLLPCNVVVREVAPQQVQVAAVHPMKMFAVVGRDEVVELAETVEGLLRAGIDKLAKGE